MVVLALAAVCAAGSNLSVEDLKKRLATRKDQDRPPVCLQIAERQLEEADKLYLEGKVEPAATAVEDVATYVEQARDSAILTGKHLKDTEITTRKVEQRLVDIKRTLAFEDQPAVEKAIARLELVRDSLLKRMFGGGNK